MKKAKTYSIKVMGGAMPDLVITTAQVKHLNNILNFVDVELGLNVYSLSGRLNAINELAGQGAAQDFINKQQERFAAIPEVIRTAFPYWRKLIQKLYQEPNSPIPENMLILPYRQDENSQSVDLGSNGVQVLREVLVWCETEITKWEQERQQRNGWKEYTLPEYLKHSFKMANKMINDYWQQNIVEQV